MPSKFRVAEALSRGLLPLALAVLLFGPCADAQNGNGAQTVRLLTYNISRDTGGSDSNVSAQASLARVVNFLNPDVWTITELGGVNAPYNATTAYDTLTTFINSDLTIFGASPQAGRDYFVYLSADDDGYESTAIVSRYPFLSTQTFSDAGGGFRSLRGLALANVALPDGSQFGVFTTHLKAGYSAGNAEKRQSETDADSHNIQTWMSAHPGEGVTFSGDCNESEDPQDAHAWSGGIGGTLPNGETYHPISTLKSAGLADPHPVSVAGSGDTVGGPGARFDYTLYTPGSLTFVGGQVFDTKQLTAAGQLPAGFLSTDSATASDHLPVLSVFQIGAAPEPGGGLALLVGALSLGVLRLRRRKHCERVTQAEAGA